MLGSRGRSNLSSLTEPTEPVPFLPPSLASALTASSCCAALARSFAATTAALGHFLWRIVAMPPLPWPTWPRIAKDRATERGRRARGEGAPWMGARAPRPSPDGGSRAAWRSGEHSNVNCKHALCLDSCNVSIRCLVTSRGPIQSQLSRAHSTLHTWAGSHLAVCRYVICLRAAPSAVETAAPPRRHSSLRSATTTRTPAYLQHRRASVLEW